MKPVMMVVAALAFATTAFAQAKQVKYVKFEAHGTPAWGILENENTIQELSGAPWLSTTKPTGRGLGLAFVRRVIEAHGGRVDLATRSGRGTRASLIFPLSPGQGAF